MDNAKFADFEHLRNKNTERAALWTGHNEPSLEFRMLELFNEVGEAGGEVKKLLRDQLGYAGGKGHKEGMDALATELADIIICTDLVAITAGIDLWKAVVSKFNETSDKHGFDVHMTNTKPVIDPLTQEISQ